MITIDEKIGSLESEILSSFKKRFHRTFFNEAEKLLIKPVELTKTEQILGLFYDKSI